ncbi:MAG TPA: hypothetical protein VG604_00890 [Candidatus Saccharimonadales bacterium]|nr:hypothetical protein [Candidatus Saccharimonadales bacterium]
MDRNIETEFDAQLGLDHFELSDEADALVTLAALRKYGLGLGVSDKIENSLKAVKYMPEDKRKMAPVSLDGKDATIGSRDCKRALGMYVADPTVSEDYRQMAARAQMDLGFVPLPVSEMAS